MRNSAPASNATSPCSAAARPRSTARRRRRHLPHARRHAPAPPACFYRAFSCSTPLLVCGDAIATSDHRQGHGPPRTASIARQAQESLKEAAEIADTFIPATTSCPTPAPGVLTGSAPTTPESSSRSTRTAISPSPTRGRRARAVQQVSPTRTRASPAASRSRLYHARLPRRVCIGSTPTTASVVHRRRSTQTLPCHVSARQGRRRDGPRLLRTYRVPLGAPSPTTHDRAKTRCPEKSSRANFSEQSVAWGELGLDQHRPGPAAGRPESPRSRRDNWPSSSISTRAPARTRGVHAP